MNADRDGAISPSFFRGSTSRQLSEAFAPASINLSSPKAKPSTAHRRSLGTTSRSRAATPGLRSARSPTASNPLLLPYVANLWGKVGDGGHATSKLQPKPRPKGLPALLPPWMEDHMTAMSGVTTRFSCAIAMALASELEQRMVDDIMRVSGAELHAHMDAAKVA